MKSPLDAIAARNLAARPVLRDHGSGYSRFVSLTKWILPVIALVLLLLVAVWPRLESSLISVRFSLPRIDINEARDLRMVQLRYSGIDKQNRPFVVTSDVARQMPKTDELVSLDGPKADMVTTSGNWLEISSNNGIYQPQAQLLDLFGEVALYQDKGNEFHSDSAHLDMASGTAEGHDKVEGQGPFGHVTAEGFRILNHGETVIFTGHAKLELRTRGKDDE